MPQPTPYVRNYSFTDFQSGNPVKPLPGNRVDAELNAVQQTFTQLLANLKLVQRDDGAIANKSVGIDQLKSEVNIGINEVTTWITGHQYIVNDAVWFNGALYIAAKSHTATAFPADLAAGNWTVQLDISAQLQDFLGHTPFLLIFLNPTNYATPQACLDAAVSGGIVLLEHVNSSTMLLVPSIEDSLGGRIISTSNQYCIQVTGDHLNINNLRLVNTNGGGGIHQITNGADANFYFGLRVDTPGYAFLDNNATSDKQLFMGFDLRSQNADAYESNHPTNIGYNRILIGGYLNADNFGSASQSGFAYGVARTNGHILMGVTIVNSRQEAIHIEDQQKRGIVMGVNAPSCKKDGIHLLASTSPYDPVLIFGCHMLHTGTVTGFSGHHIVSDNNGAHKISINHGSFFKGFDTGLISGDTSLSNFDGCIVDSCNIALIGNKNTLVIGDIFSTNTPVLAEGFAGTYLGGVHSNTQVTTILARIGTTWPGCYLKRWTTPFSYTHNGGGNVTFPLYAMPPRLRGDLNLIIEGTNALAIDAHLFWNGSVLSVSEEMVDGHGVMGHVGFSVVAGMLCYTFYSTIPQTNTFKLRFEGKHYQN